jgi:arginase
MPAVDYRQPDGLQWAELSQILHTVNQTPGFIGLDLTIFNPTLDPDGVIAQNLVNCLTNGLS